MITKYKNYLIGAGVVVILLLVSFIGGCQRGKHIKECPPIITNTITIHDTVTRTIVDRYPYYVDHVDTVIYDHLILQDVDTATIMKDYFATHIVNRYWQDSLLRVDLTDYISQNKLVQNVFKYNILRPQSIITNTVDNSVHYSSYLYLGGTIPINKFDYSSVDLTLALPKWYAGAGYLPGVNAFAIKGGIKIFQFKKR